MQLGGSYIAEEELELEGLLGRLNVHVFQGTAGGKGEGYNRRYPDFALQTPLLMINNCPCTAEIVRTSTNETKRTILHMFRTF